MNAVEIEAAISALAELSFDGAEFPFAFLEAFGNKATTIKRLRTGSTNKSDVGGVLQTNNIHIAVAERGAVSKTLEALKASPATSRAKAKFILATDGKDFEAEDLQSGDTVACAYQNFPDHFGFFLPLAGISTVKQISDNAFDIRATSRLNRLYLELLKDNPDWGSEAQRHEMNHFMARLIFCFFAEDTDIFSGTDLFTDTITQMSERDSANTHEVIGEIFRAMNTAHDQREKAKLPRWANGFPYVNGGLFSGSVEVPRFSKISRSYLLHIGSLDWTQINPDIFGSMIQAVADEEERGALGMHYTSVPNILKVLNPLFLDDLREKLEEAGNNSRKLLNLRNRMARIRVFDPACGSGNFLVIAYKQMREIENTINERRGETGRKSDIPLTNFRGIELRDFSAEIARLALIIAEYQCDVSYRGQQEALQEFLPLDAENWITQGNALRLDWLSICPPTGTGVKHRADDLFEETNQAEIDFENEGGETYICGNPPYRGSKWQSEEQKSDLLNAWVKHPKLAKTTDFVTGWFARFFDYLDHEPGALAAFVATNSVCQGQQATEVWPAAFDRGCEIRFAHTSFKWANLASHNAGVTVVIIGIGKKSSISKILFQEEQQKKCSSIGPYLTPDSLACVQKAKSPISEQSSMFFGNMPRDGGNLFLDTDLAIKLMEEDFWAKPFIKHFVGSDELIKGRQRYCLWIDDDKVDIAKKSDFITSRLQLVAENRSQSNAESTRQFAERPHRFVQIAGRSKETVIVVPRVSSENRQYLPVDYLTSNYIVGDRNFALYDAPLWNMGLIASRLHWVWIGTVCVRLEMRFSYSNTLGWNTFPVPTLTEKNKADLTRCAENILLAREAHFPATIADLYKPETMPDNLRAAHERNDEVLERIYIGRRFKNDTERLEKLFELYTKMTAAPPSQSKSKQGAS
ncbi:MAG: lactate dehydrogenase [Alcanivorax sp.]|uniref:class I SAM-dependent DNA methyltransferase n=1 Tax=Alcanivorax sp. TaxID=1872427 RepID=UPI000C9780EE|nr:DNA methyltransferase [Alcanivorax sp.]MAC14083.1 lactate dehydrogenase [Alcanivorax sp.]|tara:strand:+ start:3969 stop:6731 length:2763 start_codon:yes stop_codon:yes gene_type:complete